MGVAVSAALGEAPGDTSGGALERAPTQPAPATNMAAATAANLRRPREFGNIDAIVGPSFRSVLRA